MLNRKAFSLSLAMDCILFYIASLIFQVSIRQKILISYADVVQLARLPRLLLPPIVMFN